MKFVSEICRGMIIDLLFSTFTRLKMFLKAVAAVPLQSLIIVNDTIPKVSNCGTCVHFYL